jgi:hypothetical protein
VEDGLIEKTLGNQRIGGDHALGWRGGVISWSRDGLVLHVRLADASMAGRRVGGLVTVRQGAVQDDVIAEEEQER